MTRTTPVLSGLSRPAPVYPVTAFLYFFSSLCPHSLVCKPGKGLVCTLTHLSSHTLLYLCFFAASNGNTLISKHHSVHGLFLNPSPPRLHFGPILVDLKRKTYPASLPRSAVVYLYTAALSWLLCLFLSTRIIRQDRAIFQPFLSTVSLNVFCGATVIVVWNKFFSFCRRGLTLC
ncbi:uncharacterized protein V2V93DRAFT_368847 [Kockiozyma suomiensis]|uniref:uncharacterized protein n=1 Tax=Kockiozyma suomiensis TaxID=1337062 RepID=UPI0033437AC5